MVIMKTEVITYYIDITYLIISKIPIVPGAGAL
jgi:hypothetical protein